MHFATGKVVYAIDAHSRRLVGCGADRQRDKHFVEREFVVFLMQKLLFQIHNGFDDLRRDKFQTVGKFRKRFQSVENGRRGRGHKLRISARNYRAVLEFDRAGGFAGRGFLIERGLHDRPVRGFDAEFAH